MEFRGGVDDNSEEEDYQDNPGNGEDGSGFSVEEVDHLAALLHEDVLVEP